MEVNTDMEDDHYRHPDKITLDLRQITPDMPTVTDSTPLPQQHLDFQLRNDAFQISDLPYNGNEADLATPAQFGGEYDSVFGYDYETQRTVLNEDYKQQSIRLTDSPVLQQEPQFLQNISFNMPGAFRNDNMDLDESPPFTIELDAFADPGMETHSINHDTESIIRSVSNSNINQNPSFSIRTPQNDSPNEIARISSYSNINQQHINVNNYSPNVNTNPQSNNINVFGQHRDFATYHETNNLRKGSIDSYYSTNNINVNTNAHASNSYSNASLGVNNNFYNELSPLTTTTSLTPSIGSIHSNQPSFFSANQYLTRNSLDQPPSSLNRTSFDIYSKNRPSMDSQQSAGQRQPSGGRYTSFTNSITNIIPFMGDRNQRSPNSSPSPQSQSNAFVQVKQPNAPTSHQSRHLIRSIFKSSVHNTNNGNTENEPSFEDDGMINFNDGFIETKEPETDFIMTSPTKEEPEFEALDSAVPTKKPKRSKRSLFTRFKAPIKQESLDGSDPKTSEEYQAIQKNSYSDSDGLDNSMIGNISYQASSVSRTPSQATNNVDHLDSVTLNSSQNNTSNTQQEPDYAALFENVGKRYRKAKTKVKIEPDSENEKLSLLNFGSKKNKGDVKIEPAESQLSGERSSIFRVHSGSGSFHSHQSNGSMSGSSYDAVSNNNDAILEHSNEFGSSLSPTTSSISAASKRILGSKISQKKKAAASSSSSTPIATMILNGVEVQVDLKSLDLPADTQIFPTSIINSKNRTRGRKENKEADLLDLSKIYLCNYCSRRFKRQEHLKRHFRSLHTFEKPYDCTICHKKFSRSDNLNQHMKIHKAEDEEQARLLMTAEEMEEE